MPTADLVGGEPERSFSFDHGSRSISWSKNGFICYASSTSLGHNLNMTFLENTNGSNWQLAAPHKLTIKPSENSAIPRLQLVSWSNISTDLAVFDEHGNFYILLAGVGLLRSKRAREDRQHHNSQSSNTNGTSNTSRVPGFDSAANNDEGEHQDGPSYELTSYNHAEMIYRDISPNGISSNTHGRCVAFEWLGIDKPQIINKPAIISADATAYTYGVHSFQSPLLAHPITTKQACVALRENGILDFYHQGEHKVEYHKLSTNLAPNGAEGTLYFTHASIGFTADKKILVTAYDAMSRKILTYCVSIDWGFLVDSAVKQKSDPHFYTPKDQQTPLTLGAALLHEMSPLPDIQGDTTAHVNGLNFEQYRIISIDIMSPYYLSGSSLDILISYEMITSDSVVSCMIQRFQIKEEVQLLKSPFSEMDHSDTEHNGKLCDLVLQDKLVIPTRLKSVRTAISGSIILLVSEDSNIIPVNRANWSLLTMGKHAEVKSEPNGGQIRPGSITSLLDCGFEIPRLRTDPCPFLFAVSPNLTGVVHISAGSHESAVYTGLIRRNEAVDVPLMSSAFSHAHAHACYTNTSSDDLMALIQVEYDKLSEPQRHVFIHSTIVESHSAINFHLNSFNKESVDKLLSNPPLQKLLSLQLTLSDLGQKQVSGDIAWIILSLRSTSFGIMFSLSSIYRQMSKKKPVEDSMEDSINRAECIISLVGSVKWFIDLLIYLNQELLQLSSVKNSPDQSIISIRNSVVLPIIMSKVPRLFLMYAITSIGKTHEILKKLHKDLSESNKLFTPMKEALERFFNTSNYSPLKLNNFESFLRECDDYITKEIASKSTEQAKLLQYEQQLFCDGLVPNDLFSIAHTIIDRFSANNNRDARLSQLYFYDSSWLQVGAVHQANTIRETRNSWPEATQVRLQYSATQAVDALRKVFISCASPIASGGTTPMGQYFNSTYKLKKCVRCRSVSLVSDPLIFDSSKTIGLWTMVFQRNCICGSAWVNCATDEIAKT